jgi:hypothetical protein
VTEPLTPAVLRARVVWEEIDRVPVFAANQFVVQMAMSEAQGAFSEVVLTVGYLPPPLLVGTPEEQREAATAIDHVTVRPIARFSVPAAKATELAQLIQGLLQGVQAAGQQS